MCGGKMSVGLDNFCKAKSNQRKNKENVIADNDKICHLVCKFKHLLGY